MATGIDGFRQLGTGAMSYDREIKRADDGGVRKSDSSRLSARIQGWWQASTPLLQQHRQQERIGVKQEFYNLLVKTEGQNAANRAMGAGVPGNLNAWLASDRPLTSRMVTQILDKAQELRMGCVKHNDSMLNTALKDRSLQGPDKRDLRAAISQMIKSDPRYGSEKLTQANINDLRNNATVKYDEARNAQCKERFPSLSNLVDRSLPGSPLNGVKLEPKTLLGDVAVAIGTKEPLATRSLMAMQETTELLGKSAWNQEGLRSLGQDLTAQHDKIDDLLNQVIVRDFAVRAEIQAKRDEHTQLNTDLQTMRRDAPGNLQGIAALQQRIDTVANEFNAKLDNLKLIDALEEDLHGQLHLLNSKSAYVDELRLNDPLTDRSVKHSNMVWANAGNVLLDKLDAAIENGNVNLTGAQRLALQQTRLDWQDKIGEVARTYTESNNDNLQQISAKKGDQHPISQGKKEIQDSLRTMLEQVGVPKEALKDLLSDKSWKQAEPKALAGLETWQPVDRNMIVMRDGVMRNYKSEVTPGHLIDSRLGIANQNGGVGGTSAGVTDSLDHARNLKVSKLIGTEGQNMTTMIGHGVLDMWGVRDPQARQTANEQGAKEVLELALSSNDRLRTALENRNPQNLGPNPKLVHVSVNLISPDSLRDNLGIDAYQERTYTFNQFEAFNANSGQDKDLRLLGGVHQGQDNHARVDVDAITFSFGINAIATGGRQHLMRTWGNVHEHNTENMVKLVGDLGDGSFGARGARPGGFIGNVYDRLERVANDVNSTPQQQTQAREQMGQLRAQTDLVRQMFTEETFKSGNGDTAKMGREILVLQGMAEQSLQSINAQDLAGTMSKGCKSDKDRGGVTDVEVKSKLILRDMGGEMNPDDKLLGDDQGVYYTVSASSGQLENQRWNTGLQGSKEAGHLKERLPDPQVRQYLCGLGAFAKA